MQKLFITTIAALIAFSTATVQAKDKDKHKSKKHHRDDHKRYGYVQSNKYRGNSHAYAVQNNGRGWDGRDYGNRYHDHTRTIYVIRNDRPLQQVVYVDENGRYYRRDGGERSYVRSHYFESYPSRYFTSSGQRRISITLPF